MLDLHQNKLSTKIILSVEIAIIIWLCFLITSFIGYQETSMNVIGGFWASVTAVIVIQNTRNIISQVTIIRINWLINRCCNCLFISNGTPK